MISHFFTAPGAFAAKPLNLSILFTQFSILLEMPPPNHKKAP
ncbi:MAG: hypothetical protein ACFWUL_04730 [Dialister sp.]|jgi:hypothetical protein